MIHKLVLTQDTDLKEAVLLLDKNGNGFLPIIDVSGKLLGILTDGDIRRAIIKNETKVDKIYNKNPIVASFQESRQSIVRRLHELKRRQMPIVDESGNYLDVIILNDFNEKKHDNTVVIMAGGLGSRLGELTKEIPKPMLPVRGKPILEEIIERFKMLGFHRFVFCLNYKAEIISNYFEDGQKFNCNIKYTYENRKLGTAGALSIIDSEWLTDSFIITNGDVLTNCNYEDFIDFHMRSNADATMCIRQHPFQIPFATVEVDDKNRLVVLEEKPTMSFFINAGIYCLQKDCIMFLNRNEYFDMPNLFNLIKDKGLNILTYKMDDDWIDIGHPTDYININRH